MFFSKILHSFLLKRNFVHVVARATRGERFRERGERERERERERGALSLSSVVAAPRS